MGDKKFWDEKIATMEKDELKAVQLKRLKATLKHCYDNNDFYKKRISDAGLDPDRIEDLSDLEKLPFTSKEELREHYPFGLFCTPLEDVIRIHSSSGTTGNPTVVGYTREDLDMWADVLARIMYDVGTRRNDVVQVSHGFGLFTGGFGFQAAAETIGSMMVPASGGNTERQLKLMTDFKTTVLCCTPSYTLYMAEVAEKTGVDISKLHLKLGFFGAEPWTEAMRKEIEERLHITALDSYGLSEVIGPGVSCECLEQKGLHINEDHFLTEIIDPASGETLPAGQNGEIVFTSLTKKAFPVLRYRTKDISYLMEGDCACGNKLVRMAKPMGRTDDMMIIRGVNIFPSQIEEVLMNIGDLEPHYLIVLDTKNYMDTIEVWVEVSENKFHDKIMDLEDFEKSIESRLYSAIGIRIKASLKEPNTIARSEGKAQRVLDKRKKN
jgi:phenylacetate-CoA ligase